MTTNNDVDSCLYRFLETMEVVGTVLFALLYIFSGPGGGDDEPWQIPPHPNHIKENLMTKIRILTTCDHCDGEAYLSAVDAVNAKGETYTRYQSCPYCEGTGLNPKWIELREFVDMLNAVAVSDPMEPDWKDLAQRKPTSQMQDSREAAGIP